MITYSKRRPAASYRPYHRRRFARKAKGRTSTGTINNVREALRYLVKEFGATRVREFGPKKLNRVRPTK